MPAAKKIDYSRCPHCDHKLNDKFLLRAGASARSRARPIEARKGRKKILTPCPWCRQKFGVAELRKHRGECASRP
jgi:ssDNA-binding Zn-finger/Zn-ribbon topoisomerase 1